MTDAQQSADPTIEFQSPYWNPVSDQAKSSIRRLVALDPLHRPIAQEALCDPWLATTTDTPSHVDLSPTLAQSWSTRAKQHSALTSIRAADRFSYFSAAAASRSSTQSSGGWNDLDSNPVLKEKEEDEDLGQSDIVPGSSEPFHQEPSLP